MNKVILLTGGIVTVAYLTEYFIGWYSGVPYENYTYLSFGAATGPYWWAFWALIICNLIMPLTLWVKKWRRNILWTFIVALVINIGMWFERFDIIVICLSKDRLASTWTMFSPTFVDIGVFVGTIGFFFVLFLLYARTFPVIAQAEVKSILKSSGERYKRIRESGEDLAGTATDKRTSNYATRPESLAAASNAKSTYHQSTVNADALVDTETKKAEIDLMLAKIGTYDPATQSADDLKKISGVGPVLEQKLHQLGIYTYDQVSKMTKTEYDLLDEIIDAFPGRAERDDWAGQAQNLKQ
tara:strand:- start:909 stop:1802 length:894 start_codon:yes stop_codon:yes gene_type:complete